MNEHYDEATLADYLDGPEAFAERAPLERHLAQVRTYLAGGRNVILSGEVGEGSQTAVLEILRFAQRL